MKKKRREIENCEVLNLIELKTNLKGCIAKEINRTQEEKLICIEYWVLSKFGKGSIIEYCFNSIVISISRFVLTNDLIIYNQSEKNKIQLSFLLEGKKIICLNNDLDETTYESQESYMAYIETYCGYNRISSDKAFKEIKITLPKLFLEQHGITSSLKFKEITDTNLIIPITDDLLSVLIDLETNRIKGISRIIYFEAKVLEILAIQIENYKRANLYSPNFKNQKLIKKLFGLKQFLKDNVNKNYTINELSSEVGLNESFLKGEFKKQFKITLSQYFISEKMNKAKQLLQNSDLPIYQIAEDVGYKNATHFSAAFKRYYNETPKSCRVKN